MKWLLQSGADIGPRPSTSGRAIETVAAPVPARLLVYSAFVVERQELIELRLYGNQFVLTLQIDADRLNVIDRNRFVVDPIDL